MLSRRGFISSLAGVVAWAKSPKLKGISPAASAIQPTCSMDDAARRDGSSVIDRVNLSSLDSAWVNNSNAFQVGQLVDIYSCEFAFRGTAMVASIYAAKDILHLSWDSLPQPGDYLVVNGVAMPIPADIPCYQFKGSGNDAYVGLGRS